MFNSVIRLITFIKLACCCCWSIDFTSEFTSTCFYRFHDESLLVVWFHRKHKHETRAYLELESPCNDNGILFYSASHGNFDTQSYDSSKNANIFPLTRVTFSCIPISLVPSIYVSIEAVKAKQLSIGEVSNSLCSCLAFNFQKLDHYSRSKHIVVYWMEKKRAKSSTRSHGWRAWCKLFPRIPTRFPKKAEERVQPAMESVSVRLWELLVHCRNGLHHNAIE